MVDITKINFEKGNGFIPVIAQDVRTMNVLMCGFANQEAVLKTIESGLLTLYSRSRNRIWTKGESSGHTLKVVSLDLDCDNDCILASVVPHGPTCHTGRQTCWGDTLSHGHIQSLNDLESVIGQRIYSEDITQASYTKSLVDSGIKKIAQKVGEEAVELILEAESGTSQDFANEVADLLFHLLVLLQAKNMSLQSIIEVLDARHNDKK